MLKLTIIEKDQYANFVLEDKNGKKYNANINFMGMENPSVGTILFIDESVLDEKVSLNYGKVGDERLESEKELIILQFGDEKKYLQRYYG